jgi:predicted phage terminase large subunit-like protein
VGQFEWRPNPGPQEAFHKSGVYELGFGGEAGGGKSDSLLVEALRYIHVPGYTAVIFRRTFPELSQPNGLITRAHTVCPLFGGTYNKQEHTWTFPSGATLTFSHLEHEEDVHGWQSAEIAYLAFDELTSFTSYQFRYMQSRVRTTAKDPATGLVVPARIRWASNPGNVGHEWVFERYKPWLTRIDIEDEPRWPDGETHWFVTKDEEESVVTAGAKNALSRSFIRSRRFDNPKLMEVDPGYEARLQALPLIERMQLAEGDWDIVAKGNVFHADWFKIVSVAPEGLKWFRYWDLAASTKTRASFTAAAAIAAGPEGEIYIRDMYRKKVEWPDAKKEIKATTLREEDVVEVGIEKKLHGIAAWQELMRDPELTGHRIVGVDVDADKLTRALAWSSKAEHGQVFLVEGRWIPGFLTEASLFDGSGRTPDDQIDTVSGGVRMAASPRWRTIKFLHL